MGFWHRPGQCVVVERRSRPFVSHRKSLNLSPDSGEMCLGVPIQMLLVPMESSIIVTPHSKTPHPQYQRSQSTMPTAKHLITMELFLITLIVVMFALASARNTTMATSTNDYAKPTKPTTSSNPIPTVDSTEECDPKGPKCPVCCNLFTRYLSECKYNGNSATECAKICPDESCRAKFIFVRGHCAGGNGNGKADVGVVRGRVPHELVRQERVDGDGDGDGSAPFRWT